MRGGLRLGFGLGIGRGGAAGETVATEAPTVTSSSYSNTTQTLTLTLGGAAQLPATVYVASVTNPSTPTGAQILAGTGGGILDAGNFAVGSAPDSDVLSFTNEAADEIHLYVTNDAGNTGNPSALNNTIVTGVVIDDTAPGITSYSPADNATSVATDSNLVIVFNESMDTSATTTVTLKVVGGATVETFDTSTDGTWSTTTNANDTITLNPASDLTNEENYAVQYSGFQDLYGNTVTAVSDDTTWNFQAAAAAGTNIMAGIGDFASATGWNLDTGLSITGGVLDINTGSNFIVLERTGSNRVSCPAGVTLDLSFDMVSLTNAERVDISLQSYDSGGSAIDSLTEAFDTATDGAITSGINSKAACYTTPSGTTTVRIVITFVLSGFVGQMDDLELAY